MSLQNNVLAGSLKVLTHWIPELTLLGDDISFTGICTDSRQIKSGNLFIALRGQNFDGHQFLNIAKEAGAAAAVIEADAKDIAIELGLPVLITSNTRFALGTIARYWRRQFEIPILAITGSNGKTTVKEMVSSILRAAVGEGHYLATEANFNNDIGVPLMLAKLNQAHQIAALEMGMNHPGEIAELGAIAEPTIALINNAQREHLEFMQDVKAVAQENGNILNFLPKNGVAVFPEDDAYAKLWHQMSNADPAHTVITFGFTEHDQPLSSTHRVFTRYQSTVDGLQLEMSIDGTCFPIKLSAFGEHNARNAMAAAACALGLGIPLGAIQKGLAEFRPVKGRLQAQQLNQNKTLFDDTYNANPDSVKAAIDVLAGAASPRLLVLGDMGEIGTQGVQLHEEIGAYARERGIEKLYAVGILTQHSVQAFGEDAKHFSQIDDLLSSLEQALPAYQSLLVKGSRFMKMERVIHFLQQYAA